MTTAWLDVVNKDGSDEWLEVCNAALMEVQRVTLDRAIKRLEAWIVHPDGPDRYELSGLREAVQVLTSYRDTGISPEALSPDSAPQAEQCGANRTILAGCPAPARAWWPCVRERGHAEYHADRDGDVW